MSRYTAILVGIILAGSAGAQQDASHSDEPVVDEALVGVLDRLDTKLASTGGRVSLDLAMQYYNTGTRQLCDNLIGATQWLLAFSLIALGVAANRSRTAGRSGKTS